jgi:hypothetical protein
VTSRDVVLAEASAAFGILGLLLVFLPLFLQAFERAVAAEQPYLTVRAIGYRASFVAGSVALAAAVATLGLLALWIESDALAVVTGVGLLVLTWCVAALAAMAAWKR